MDTQDTVQTIHHVESLRRKPSYYWPQDNHRYVETGTQCYRGRVPFGYCFRPALNLRTLISLLSPKEDVTLDDESQEEEFDEPSTSYSTPRKRKRSESPSVPSKRARLDLDEFNFDFDPEPEEEDRYEDGDDYMDPQYRQIYPSYWESLSRSNVINEVFRNENTTFFQVYQLKVNLRYNRVYEDGSEDYVDDNTAKKWAWLKEEEKLVSLLEARTKDSSLPQVIDMGRFFMARYLGRYLALSAEVADPENYSPETIRELSERWLLLLPDIPWPDGITAEYLGQFGMQPTGGHEDFITACAVLQSHDRARLEGNLQLHILPAGTYDPTREFPFELRAHFSLSLSIPQIYHPFSYSLSQREVNELEGLQLRLISFVSQSPLTDFVCCGPSNEVADVTIPFFLGSMGPAPPLPPGVTYELLQPDGLQATLLPFQRRTVAWMLEREGKRITQEGNVVPIVDLPSSDSGVASASRSQAQQLPVFWEKIEMAGQRFFFNRLTSAVSPSLPVPHPALGGILAEEPGLGKTMECLALMLLNPAPERNPSNMRWDPEAQLHVKEIKTTLIVTPPALAAQWVDELAAHAPDLRVFVYEGWAKVGVPITEADVEAEREKRLAAASRRSRSNGNGNGKRNGKGKSKILGVEGMVMAPNPNDPILDWPNFINQFDVCITTYNALRADITVARAPPKRPRRQDVEYKNLERPRSPLVMCEWYRVIMDEVQMMGTGKSEEMVSLVPRLSSFAVSGTPARAQVSDLIRVLRFLRVDDLVAPARMWNRLLKHGFKDLFASFFQKYSVRTLKSSVKDELTIPHQQRYLVGIDLGRVERHVYDQALEESLVELGLDARGVAGHEGWEVDAGVLRNVLRRLRGICTHPQVGQPRQDKLFKPGVLKSMSDVLEAMKDQNWRNLMEDRRAKVLSLTRLAQLQQHQSDDLDRYQRALERLLTAEAEANQLIDEIKAVIAQHHLKGDALKKEALALRDSRKINVPDDARPEPDLDKGKGKEVESDAMDLDDDSDEDEDVEDRGLPKTPAGEEHRIKRIALLARLRECFMVLHRVKFLQGDVYHVLGSSYSEKEDTAYGDAENLRKDLLKSTEETASRAMRKLSVDATEKRVTERALRIKLPFLSGGGIRSTHLFDEANELIEDVLNEQTILLWEWRTKIVGLLSQKLNSAGEQADGEEYSRTLDIQGEAEVYLQAYASLLADRREAIAAERTLLAAHEGREKKTRKTKASLAARRAQPREEDDLEIPDDVEVQPQHEVLHGQLLEKRKELQIEGRALKSVMVDLSAVAARIGKETDPEKIIARDGTTMLRTLIAGQLELMDKLDADLTQLRKVFNDRIVYFRQLQEISDTVTEVIWDSSVAAAMATTSKEYTDLGTKINAGRARQRYLEHLAREGATATNEEDALCILCQCEFTRGFITQCAHVFCEGCMKLWMSRGQGRACPVCRSPIDPDQLQRFAIHDDQPAPQRPTMTHGEPVPVSRRQIQYNTIDPTLYADIQTMESNGSYGSKIQTLIRHLLHIQLVDPGAKSIVFSAWADSLAIIEHALVTNRIPCLRLDHNQGKGKLGGAKRFRIDPSLQVLLLHGERDNAGLNVTCASRVFLVESVVNHGFEVQAIARIDRMGQTRPTEVFCYYAEETVEKNILDLAARQGLSLYTKDNSGGSLNVTSFAMDSQKKLVDSPTKGKKGQSAQKGDFIFKVNDMLAILFPHMFEDIEFLLPPDAEQESSMNNTLPGNARPLARPLHVNAEAGPSRIPAS